jgi:hypothetical protein
MNTPISTVMSDANDSAFPRPAIITPYEPPREKRDGQTGAAIPPADARLGGSDGPACPHDVSTPVATAAPDPAERTESPDVMAAVSAAEALTLALSPPQQTAIQLLTSGHTLVASATAAGVNRVTLYRWLKRDPAFVAAYNAWQKDVIDTARGRILALSGLAVTTVARAMSTGNAKVAVEILKSMGILDRAEPGSTDATEVERKQKLEDLQAKTKLRKAESRAEMESYEPL